MSFVHQRYDVPILPSSVLPVDRVQFEYPGLSRSHLYKLSALGKIEILKIGRRAVVRRSDIERLIDNAPRLHPPPVEEAQATTARDRPKSPATVEPALKGRRRAGVAGC